MRLVKNQISLVLKRLGFPRDLRRIIVKLCWFDCESEVLRRERICNLQWQPRKFVIPILIHVELAKDDTSVRNGLSYFKTRRSWGRSTFQIEHAMRCSNDETFFPSLRKLRHLKKIKR
jgi:hypothetical protein